MLFQSQRQDRALRCKRPDLHSTPKTILSPLSWLLRTRSRTDTVDRLFDSRHVNDLRLIAATAFVITVGIAGISVGAAAIAWSLPCKDGAVLHECLFGEQIFNAGEALLRLFVPALTAFGAILAWAYQRGSNRLGVVDLFACEMDAICRSMTVTGTVEILATRDTRSAITNHFDSEENYFPILDGNSGDLQSLEAEVVGHITAFYTFMKFVRDKLRSGVHADSPEARNAVRKDVIYMLYLGLESAGNAMDDLVEFEPAHTERTMVILLSELTAYQFLLGQYEDKMEVHHKRLALRAACYIRLMSGLERLISSLPEDHTRGRQEWSPALQLWPALRDRYDQLNRQFPLPDLERECAKTEVEPDAIELPASALRLTAKI